MVLTAMSYAGAAITVTLVIASVSTLSVLATAAEHEHAFIVEQPPIALPLTLKKTARLERVRINLPEIIERIEVSPGRNVAFLPSEDVAATLDTAERSISVLVRLDEAHAIATMDGRAEIRRAMHVYDRGEEMASLEIQCSVDLFGLADEAPHATLRNARVASLKGMDGVFESAELAGGGVIATPVFPLELTPPRVHAEKAGDKKTVQPTATIEPRR
jgi:hypothetical protein